MQPPRARHAFLTNLSAGARLDALLVSAIAALLGLRLYLYLSGFPQVGGKSFHIAHLLYGGLLMIVALVILLAFLDRTAEWTAAIVGGAGFGIFIDELGKFITRDINYFYRPAISIIYLIFIALYLGIRQIMDHQPATPETSLVNALEVAKGMVTQSASASDLHHLHRFLERVDRANPLVQALEAEANRVQSLERRGRTASLLIWIHSRYRSLVQQPSMHVLVVIACLLATALALLVASVETVTRTGSRLSTLIVHGHFAVLGGVAFAACALTCTAIGLSLLPRSRPAGYRWLRLAMLISIFLTQVFLFYYIQFYALLGLAGEIVVLAPLTTIVTLTHTHAGSHRG